ncbi:MULTISPECIES: MtrAB system response regulator MtrA [Rhodoluna]|jgi:two-component system, OmpR family, response regulator MtrA|uniref:MtrAB system response regulator MtrA n=1 Tax=Rhodoluna TaxID=529883 RepID=UPI0011064BCE|nr:MULTISPECIES: MtrAB system response regulator MtrA [Rhodoluna]BDS48693.1 DNA-binding response regulator [Rhodoluna sp. KAS3]
MPHSILVVDDDNALREMVGIVLESEGFEVSYHDAGSGAYEKFNEVKPDLVLLDVMLPGMDGIQVCEQIRSECGTPIIMLTAKTESEDVVRGLEAGADDYVVKPFDPAILIARIKARLRPLAEPEGETITIGPLTLDIVGHEVRRGGEKLSLTPLEFNLLLTLALKPKQVFTREMLLETVWGYHYKADTRLVNVHVQRLRSKIEADPDNPQIVTTVRGIGYKAGQN